MSKKKPGKRKCIKLARDLYRGTICVRCGAKKGEVQIQVAHIIPEENDWLCCDPLNFLNMCASDHKWGIRAMHKDPLSFGKWFHRTFPGRYIKLLHRARIVEESARRRGLEKPNWKEVYEKLQGEKKRRRDEKKG